MEAVDITTGEVLTAGERSDDEWEAYIRDASLENTILARGVRWAEFQSHCKEKHGRQGGTHFGEFAKVRFGISPQSASKWASIGRAKDELYHLMIKFAPDWAAVYLWTTLTEQQKQKLLAADVQISQKTIKQIAYGHGEDAADEWYTPQWLFDSLSIRFSIDVCSPEDRTHSSVPADTYFTEENDGLAQPWHGTVWCNPPYSDPAPWAEACIKHRDGLLLTHMPMNAEWCSKVWQTCSGLRLFQAMEFVRPDGSKQRPGYWLQLAAFGDLAADRLRRMEVPPDIAENARRVPSPYLTPA